MHSIAANTREEIDRRGAIESAHESYPCDAPNSTTRSRIEHPQTRRLSLIPRR